MHKRGAALILALAIITALSVLSGAILTRSASEARLSRRHAEATQALWLAESGVNKALSLLRANYNTAVVSGTALGAGGYSATIVSNADGTRTVTANGFVPYTSPAATRTLVVKMNKVSVIPPNFYNSAIYTAGNVNISGSSYAVTGDVIYGGGLSGDTSNVTGTVTHDSSISPLVLLDFDQLRVLSQAQGNYHDVDHLSGPFPESFWYNEEDGIPNIIFIEGNLDVQGNDTVGGFFVVGGQVTYDATISGNVTVNGAIYTRGSCKVNGGGGAGLNINGAIWSDQLDIKGSVNTSYNSSYISAIQGLNLASRVQIIYWTDTQTLYQLVP